MLVIISCIAVLIAVVVAKSSNKPLNIWQKCSCVPVALAIDVLIILGICQLAEPHPHMPELLIWAIVGLVGLPASTSIAYLGVKASVRTSK